ncbi:MAG TPA: DUF6328 family protein [Actinomycetota bacterium]|nr:DUF6328 family protein [Actinomycetota bacterium]
MAESKQDRELIELLNELRVALPGVQVLFAFLLAVPFTQRFDQVTKAQKGAFFVALITTALASAFLMAPTSMHRIQWRNHDKERLLVTSNVLTIVGLVFLAVSMISVVFTITDVLFGGPVSTWVSVAIGSVFGVLWYVLPIYRRATSRG